MGNPKYTTESQTLTRDVRKSGFTLLETLVALAIISVATAIGVSLYAASAGLRTDQRRETLATERAHSQFAMLRKYPQSFDWPESLTGLFQEVFPREDALPAQALQPTVSPTTPRRALAQSNLYDSLDTRVFVRACDGASGCCEVLVVVSTRGGAERKPYTETGLMAWPVEDGS